MTKSTMILDSREIACLLNLERQGGQAAAPADNATLDRLMVRGLIERIKVTALPLESPAHIYRLTEAGWRQCKTIRNVR